MKKKMLTGILAVSMLGLVLVGCGDKKEVTKTDESQVEITTEKESEAATETEAPTEVETEAPTEEVKADFLTENGLTVTPNGSMTIPVAKYGSDELTDLAVNTSVATVASSEEGYSDTTFTVTADKNLDNSGVSYNISAFDRYTGTSYESKLTTALIGGGASHDNVCVLDIDGTQYDCSMDAKQNGNTVTLTVHHPSNYDGVVFLLGKLTATQTDAYNALGFKSTQDVSRLKMLIRPGYKNAIETLVLANAYNQERLQLPIDVIEVPHFGGLKPQVNISSTLTDVYPIYNKLGEVIGYDTNELAEVPTYTEDDVVWFDPNKDVIAVIADKGCVFTSKQNGYTVEPIRNPRGLYNNFFANSPNNTIAYDPLYNFVIIKKSA